MARPLKHGLDYFPMDVDFFEDDKIQFVSARWDEKGELIAAKLLCKIFKAGYFIKWNDDAALLFSKGAGKNISPSLANDVVNELIKRDFFHKGLFERFSVLTSNGIQKRYIKICTDAKRKDWAIDKNYDVTLFTPEETPLPAVETNKPPEGSTQSKGKESKGKESKEGAPAGDRVLVNPFSENFLDDWLIWKEYKKKEYRFFFKSVESEQAALNELVNLAGGSEETAQKIILQSLSKGWKGLFKLKNEDNGKSGNYAGTGSSKATSSGLHEVFAQRYGKRSA